MAGISYEKRDGRETRLVLRGMITSRLVVGRVASQWPAHGGLFEIDWADWIGTQCVEHFRRHGEAPNKVIRELWANWSESRKDDAMAKTVGQFLQSLSDEDRVSPDMPEKYVVDVAGGLFTRLRTERAEDEARELRKLGRVDEAIAVMQAVRKVELGMGAWLRLGEDRDKWIQAFSREVGEPLVGYGGHLDDWLQDTMRDGNFVAFLAIEKAGKTWQLIDAAYRAMFAGRKRRRVAYFECGDMTEDDLIVRFGQRATGKPSRVVDVWRDVRRPVDVVDGEPVAETVRFDDVLTGQEAHEVLSRRMKGRELLRVCCHASGTLSVAEIDATLGEWTRDGWGPDVVVIDYADILAPPAGVRERVEQIDKTWLALRRMSQERHCLVLTATQANAGSYKTKGFLGQHSFSGSKTKNAHASAIIGLNPVHADDGLHGLVWNWVVRRTGDRRGKLPAVFGNLALGQPSIVSGKYRSRNADDNGKE